MSQENRPYISHTGSPAQLNPPPITGDAASRRRQYLLVAGLSIIVAGVAYWAEFESTLGVYLLVEALITMVAFIIGLFAAIRYFSNQGMLYLYAGVGFFSVGVLELLRLLAFTTGFAQTYHGASLLMTDYLLWSSTIVHIYLAIVMFAAMWDTRGLQHIVVHNTGRASFSVAFLAVACGLAILLGPIPVQSWGFGIARPMEVAPGILWAASAYLLYREKRWGEDTFIHWLLVALIFATGAALFLYPFVEDLTAPHNLIAQVIKLTAFTVVLVGLGNSMFELVRRVESSMLAEQQLNDTLQKEIVERRMAERALLASRAELAEAQQIAHLGSWSWEISSGKYQISDEMVQILGVPPQAGQLPIAQIRELVHPEDLPELQNLIEEAITKKQDWATYCRIIRAADEAVRVIMVRGRMGFDESGNMSRFRGTAQDLTEIVQTQQRLRETAELLAASNRDLEEFAYIASHDLQEPLRKIFAFSDRVLVRYSDRLDETARDYLDRVRAAAGRMQNLIDDVLTLSRVNIRQAPFVQIHLARIVNEVLDDLDTTIQERGAQIHLNEPLPVVHGDPVQLHQLLQNLISNALKFCPPARAPNITIETVETQTLLNGAPCATIVVADEGIGFDERYAERIFQPFHRLNSRSKFVGTGMGLSICRRIVERHGGQIRVQSKPGEGSRFFVTLPLQQIAPVEKSSIASLAPFAAEKSSVEATPEMENL